MALLGATSLTGCSKIPNFIAAGSLMMFQQTNAPVNWTKQTTHNDKSLRVVSGTASSGGTSAFTTVFASRTVPGTMGDTTLTTPQIPSHVHGYSTGTINRQASLNPQLRPFSKVTVTPALNTDPAGGGGTHNHPFTASNMDFAVQYVDVIIAQKD
jgi:hypothetical protein